MIQLKIDTSELLKYAAYMNNVPRHTKTNIARGLNVLGKNVASHLANDVADRTGLSFQTIHNLFKIKEASPLNLVWECDATDVIDTQAQLMLPPAQWRSARHGMIKPGTLVNVIDRGDDKVCQICKDIVEDNPYTIEEVNALSQRLNKYGNGLFHYNCRCSVWENKLSRRVPVRFATGLGTSNTEEVFRMTPKQLSDIISGIMLRQSVASTMIRPT